jgi:hypothetical protein
MKPFSDGMIAYTNISRDQVASELNVAAGHGVFGLPQSVGKVK